MPGLDDYGALLRSGMAAVPDYAEQQAQQQLLAIRKSEMQARTAELMAKLAQRKQFGDDVTSVLADPTPGNISSLILKHPEYAEQIKSGWDIKDKAAKQADLTQLGEIYSAASAGKWDVAAKAARARYEADKAAGQADPTEEAIISALESGDPAERNAALGMIGVQVAAATGAEHFGTVYGNLGGGAYTLDAGAARYQGRTMIAHSPFIKDADGNIRLWTDASGGESDQSPQPMDEGKPGQVAAGLAAPQAAVASTLAAGGLSPQVVAGFLGNFHAEGGYGGAKGDGGTAHGIGQWREERAANFQKVVGKPIAEATPAEQAGFVLWELQNPEKAGMTQGQVEAIKAAKTPAQAAALIDQFYERSSGQHRQKRMAAAARFATGDGATGDGQFPIAIPGKAKPQRMTAAEVAAEGLDPKKVYYRDANGVPQVVTGQASGSGQYRLLSTEQKQERGLDPAIQYQQNVETGQITALGGQSRQAKQIPQTVQNKVQPSIDVRDTMNRLLGNWRDDYGGHTVAGGALNTIQGVLNVGPPGMRDWWADFRNMDNVIRNQLFGSALTQHEKSAYAATTITPRMTPEEIKKNLTRRRQIIEGVVARQQNFLKKNGYDAEAVDALFSPLGEVGSPAAQPSTAGLPKGAKIIGTYQGRRVIQLPNGKRMVEQ